MTSFLQASVAHPYKQTRPCPGSWRPGRRSPARLIKAKLLPVASRAQGGWMPHLARPRSLHSSQSGQLNQTHSRLRPCCPVPWDSLAQLCVWLTPSPPPAHASITVPSSERLALRVPTAHNSTPHHLTSYVCFSVRCPQPPLECKLHEGTTRPRNLGAWASLAQHTY